MVLQPHRCRISELRSSLVAFVRVAVLISVSFRVLLCGLGNRMLEWVEVGLLIACASLMPCAAGSGIYSDAVDIFNVASGVWSTAALSVARQYLVATSLPNFGVAIFAGGFIGTCCHFDLRIFACFVVRGESCI